MTANASHQSKVVAMFRSILGLSIPLLLPFIRLPIMPTFLSYLFRYYFQLTRFLCCDSLLSLFTSFSKSFRQRFTYSLFPLYDSPTSYHFNLDALTLAWTTMTNRCWDSSKSGPQKPEIQKTSYCLLPSLLCCLLCLRWLRAWYLG